MREFNTADLIAMSQFVEESKNAITQFSEIRTKFANINNKLLSEWKGAGKNAYEQFVTYVTENVGNISDTFETINEMLNEILTQYNEVDQALKEFNKDPGNENKNTAQA